MADRDDVIRRWHDENGEDNPHPLELEDEEDEDDELRKKGRRR